jgi:hypothetical protein
MLDILSVQHSFQQATERRTVCHPDGTRTKVARLHGATLRLELDADGRWLNASATNDSGWGWQPSAINLDTNIAERAALAGRHYDPHQPSKRNF